MTTEGKKGRTKPMGAPGIRGSAEAKRQAAVILEVLSGLRRTEEASEAMKVTLARYYVLETRALQGLIAALEPRPKGRQRRPEDEIAALRRDNDRLQRELSRTQALVRASQRAMGIPQAPKAEDRRKLGGPGRKKRRATVRARRTVKLLRAGLEETKPEGRPEPLAAGKASPAVS
jgi:hypothetical protein